MVDCVFATKNLDCCQLLSLSIYFLPLRQLWPFDTLRTQIWDFLETGKYITVDSVNLYASQLFLFDRKPTSDMFVLRLVSFIKLISNEINVC